MLPVDVVARKKAQDILENGPGETAAERLENAVAELTQAEFDALPEVRQNVFLRCRREGLSDYAALHIARGVPDSQAFFEDYATKIRAPHFGPVHRDVLKEILIRAEEAKLYTPKE